MFETYKLKISRKIFK